MLFVDLYHLGREATDAALEFMCKAGHDHDRGIWSPHESVPIRRLVDLFTQRGLDRLATVQAAILAWQRGENHKPGAYPERPTRWMGRWLPEEMSLVRLWLEHMPPSRWSLAEHMMAVDYVVQRYLPEETMLAEAEWLAVRASLMGKVQANLEKEMTTQQADTVLAALPLRSADVGKTFRLLPQEQAMLDYGIVHAAEHVRSVTEKARHSLRTLIMQHVRDEMAGAPLTGGHTLETKLIDAFAVLNRDWRTIAVTEAGECQLQGVIASLAPGTRVKRIERYAGACGFCRKLDGRIMMVVAPDTPNKDGTTQVWIGKTNVGRSASPKKRVGDLLVDRKTDELWWPAAGLQHPNCRGRWVVVAGDGT